MSNEGESIQAKRLQWLITKIKDGERDILGIIDGFEMEGRMSEGSAANDALDALREVFPVWISELSESMIDVGMEREKC